MAFRFRVFPAVIALSASALLLSACVPSEPSPAESTSVPTTSSTPEPSATSSATAEPTTSSTPDPQATPVDIACTELITPQQMYDFNPNYVLLSSFAPDAGTPAATAVQSKGTVCRWENGTSGITIDVSVVQPAPSAVSGLKADAGSVSDSFDGYFSLDGRTGTAQVFTGPYWVTLSSQEFFRAGDATNLVSIVTAAVK